MLFCSTSVLLRVPCIATAYTLLPLLTSLLPTLGRRGFFCAATARRAPIPLTTPSAGVFRGCVVAAADGARHVSTGRARRGRPTRRGQLRPRGAGGGGARGRRYTLRCPPACARGADGERRRKLRRDMRYLGFAMGG